MRDLKLNFLLNLGRHLVSLRENKAIDNSASRRRSRTKLALSLPDNPTHLSPEITSAMSQCNPAILILSNRAAVIP
jgi:hypothetical protein